MDRLGRKIRQSLWSQYHVTKATGVLPKNCFTKSLKIHGKTSVPGSVFGKIAGCPATLAEPFTINVCW